MSPISIMSGRVGQVVPPHYGSSKFAKPRFRDPAGDELFPLCQSRTFNIACSWQMIFIKQQDMLMKLDVLNVHLKN